MIKKFAAALTALVFVAGAQAFSGQPTNTSSGYAFSETAGAGVLTFVLDGFNSLDGKNFYEDDFTVKANGSTIFDGTFNLGGGGDNDIYLQPVGTTISGLATTTDVTWAGGALTFSVPVMLANGNYTLDFVYTSLPTSTGHAGFQGIGDEGWFVESVAVTAVPEPASVALMLAGLGIVGSLARRRGARQA